MSKTKWDKDWTEREKFLLEISQRSLNGKNVTHSYDCVTEEDIERDKEAARAYLKKHGFPVGEKDEPGIVKAIKRFLIF